MVIPSIVLASNTPGEDQEPFEDVAYDAEEEEDSGPDAEEEEDSGPNAEEEDSEEEEDSGPDAEEEEDSGSNAEEEDSGPEAERARMGRGLSDKENDSEYELYLKEQAREKLSVFDKARAARDEHDNMHTQLQDEEEDQFYGDSGCDNDEQARSSMLEHFDADLTKKKEEIFILRGMLQEAADKKRRRDLDDEGDNSRRGGPSAGTTGGSSEGVEGSSKVRTESPLDFVLDKERTELPPFDDPE